MNQNSQYLAQAIQSMSGEQAPAQGAPPVDPEMLRRVMGAMQGSSGPEQAPPGVIMNLQQAGRSLAQAPGRAVRGLSGIFSLGQPPR